MVYHVAVMSTHFAISFPLLQKDVVMSNSEEFHGVQGVWGGPLVRERRDFCVLFFNFLLVE